MGIDLNLIGHFDAASLIVSWIKLQRVKVLNVAEPRKSEDSQIYSDVIAILEQVIKIFADEENQSKVELAKSKKGKISTPSETVKDQSGCPRH